MIRKDKKKNRKAGHKKKEIRNLLKINRIYGISN